MKKKLGESDEEDEGRKERREKKGKEGTPSMSTVKASLDLTIARHRWVFETSGDNLKTHKSMS